MTRNKMRVAIAISGGGTTMEAVIKATKDGRLPFVEVALVVASNDIADKAARGIAKAKAQGLDEKHIVVRRRKDYNNQEQFGLALLRECRERGVDFWSQNGWMPHTPQCVVEAFKGKSGNQHPGPIRPGRLDFGGTDMFGSRVHCARLNFVKATNRNWWTEATYQRVEHKLDEGAVIRFQQVPILRDDTPEVLQQRVLPAEHEVVIDALNDFSLGIEQEYWLSDDLVLPGEEAILAEAKADAVRKYPKG